MKYAASSPASRVRMQHEGLNVHRAKPGSIVSIPVDWSRNPMAGACKSVPEPVGVLLYLRHALRIRDRTIPNMRQGTARSDDSAGECCRPQTRSGEVVWLAKDHVGSMMAILPLAPPVTIRRPSGSSCMNTGVISVPVSREPRQSPVAWSTTAILLALLLPH